MAKNGAPNAEGLGSNPSQVDNCMYVPDISDLFPLLFKRFVSFIFSKIGMLALLIFSTVYFQCS